ncbi:hypothetical protein K7X08_028637 [Anisodus acutangulus]|uniref:Uncharacterized protein n=1 Tax=Anisodus acutangulus TaxID=402998 RepID=A0A9Q1LTL0_9SOLA|nr:hypothetical protein K7X08_028637 [Anisodus acutangulus]
MGLNEVYTVVRGSTLMMNPLPSMTQAFSIFVQEEKQRELKPRGAQLVIESTSLNARSCSTRGFMTNYSAGSSSSTLYPVEGNNYHVGSTSRFPHSTGGTNYVGSTSRFHLFCEFYKKPGHTKEKFFKLHGYPQRNPQHNYHHNNQNQGHNTNYNQNQNHRFNKGKRIAANVHGSPTDMMLNKRYDVESQNDNSNISLTKE